MSFPKHFSQIDYLLAFHGPPYTLFVVLSPFLLALLYVTLRSIGKRGRVNARNSLPKNYVERLI